MTTDIKVDAEFAQWNLGKTFPYYKRALGSALLLLLLNPNVTSTLIIFNEMSNTNVNYIRKINRPVLVYVYTCVPNLLAQRFLNFFLSRTANDLKLFETFILKR